MCHVLQRETSGPKRLDTKGSPETLTRIIWHFLEWTLGSWSQRTIGNGKKTCLGVGSINLCVLSSSLVCFCVLFSDFFFLVWFPLSPAKASPCSLWKKGAPHLQLTVAAATSDCPAEWQGIESKRKASGGNLSSGSTKHSTSLSSNPADTSPDWGLLRNKGKLVFKKKISWKPTQQMVFSWAPGGVGEGGGKGCWDNTTATRIQMTEKWQRWALRADLSPQNFTKGNYTMWRVSGPGGWPFPTCSCCQSQPRWGFYQQQSEARQREAIEGSNGKAYSQARVS